MPRRMDGIGGRIKHPEPISQLEEYRETVISLEEGPSSASALIKFTAIIVVFVILVWVIIAFSKTRIREQFVQPISSIQNQIQDTLTAGKDDAIQTTKENVGAAAKVSAQTSQIKLVNAESTLEDAQSVKTELEKDGYTVSAPTQAMLEYETNYLVYGAQFQSTATAIAAKLSALGYNVTLKPSNASDQIVQMMLILHNKQ